MKRDPKEGRSQSASNVRTPFTPIQARERKPPPQTPRRVDIDVQQPERVGAFVRHRIRVVRTAFVAREPSRGTQPVVQRDTERPRQVIVTGSRRAQLGRHPVRELGS